MSAAVAPAPAAPVPAPAIPCLLVEPVEEWDRHLSKAIADHIRPVSPISRAVVGGVFSASMSFNSASGQNDYRVTVALVGDVATVGCTCPGGARRSGQQPPRRCKHAAAFLAVLGLI